MHILTKKCALKSSFCGPKKVPPGADRPPVPVSYATAYPCKSSFKLRMHLFFSFGNLKGVEHDLMHYFYTRTHHHIITSQFYH